MNFPDETIGCGNLVDYWALTYVLEEINKKDIKIIYDGIDLIEWNYKFEEREGDKINLLKKDICEFLNQQDKLNYDVFIFPKSINELNEEINLISNCFKYKIENKEFSILATFRESTRDEDEKKFSEIISNVTKSTHYNVEFVEKYMTPPTKSEKAFSEFKPHDIEDFDGNNIVEYIKNVEKNCKYKCEDYNDFGFAPIIKERYVDYGIVKFKEDKNDS